MVSYHWLTIERRFGEARPAELVSYFTLYREHRIDPILPNGNLLFRLDKSFGRDIIEETLAGLCERYGGIHRATYLMSEDIGDTTTITLYWYRDGSLEVHDVIRRNRRYEPVGEWYLPSNTFEGIDPKYGQFLDAYEEPIRYLKLEHGFYTLSDLEATYNNDDYERCPEPPEDEVLAFRVAYDEAAYSALGMLAGIRPYPLDAVLVGDTLVVRIESGTPEEEVERRLAEILPAGYTGERVFRYRTHPWTRALTATCYEYEDGSLVVRDTLEADERGAVDHSYNPYTYDPDPASYFSESGRGGISFEDCYGHPVCGRFAEANACRIDE